MGKEKTDIKLEKVPIGALDRQKLYRLFIESSVPSIDVTEIDRDNLPKLNDDIRHKADKLLFLTLLMDYDLENQIEYRKNSKYDYLTGLLLYISSNPQFKYGFGYFKESIKNFDKMLEGWCKLINAVILDINSIGRISFSKKIFIHINDILLITIEEGNVTVIDVNLRKSDYFSCKWSNEYDFNILIPDKENEYILTSGRGNGTGEKSGLKLEIIRLNNLYNDLLRKNTAQIIFTHNHES